MSLFNVNIQSGGASGAGATLNVTCSRGFAGKTITCSDGTTTLTQVCPSTSPYEVSFAIPNSGTWTISGTIDGTTYTESVVVNLSISANLYEGFDWQTWVTDAGLDPTDYSDLDDLLANELAVRRLMIKHASVDYFCSFNNVNADMEKIIYNDICAKWINLSDYALDNMYANAAIKTAMDTADKYGYGEWVLKGQVPTMTSNTAPYGEAIESASESGYSAYKAFDGNTSTYWESPWNSSPVNAYIGYHFTSPIIPKKMVADFTSFSATYWFKDYKVQGSNDGFVSDINDLASGTWNNTDAVKTVDIENPNNDSYSYLRLLCVSGYSNQQVGIASLQFYAWQPKGCVPVMTSNSAPYGEAISNAATVSYHHAYMAFDNDETTSWACSDSSGIANSYIGYHFTNPINVKKVYVKVTGSGQAYTFKVQYSDDNSTWTDAESVTHQTTASGSYFSVDNDSYHLYWRLYIPTAADTDNTIALQFYGRSLNVSVPVMTSNTLPYGEVFATDYYSSYYPYLAFDNNASTYYKCSNGVIGKSIGYKATSKFCIKALSLKQDPSYFITGIKLQASNDGTNYDVDLLTETLDATANKEYFFEVNNSDEYLYHRIYFTNASNPSSLGGFSSLQFYGLDYSEKEFEQGTTKKWLYDHGVELVDVGSPILQNANSTGDKNDEQLHIKVSGSGASAFMPTQSIDFSNYSVLRAKLGGINYASTAANDVFGIGIKSARTYSTSDHNCIANAFYKMGVNPFTLGFDITNVTDTAYPIFHLYSSSGTYEASLSEWWLE